MPRKKAPSRVLDPRDKTITGAALQTYHRDVVLPIVQALAMEVAELRALVQEPERVRAAEAAMAAYAPEMERTKEIMRAEMAKIESLTFGKGPRPEEG